MQEFCVRGVVRGGQVVLESPLDVPDGTVVTVTDHDPADVATVGPGPNDPEAVEASRQILLGIIERARLKHLGDSEGPAKAAG